MAAPEVRSVNALAAYARQGQGSDGECTLILRGIACRLTQQDVKHILDEAGLRGKFSYVCAPRISARGSNLGYAFVRFRTSDYARECHRRCHGLPFGPAAPEKVCDVSIAKNQGDASAILLMSRRRLGGQDPGLLLCRDPLPAQGTALPTAWGAPGPEAFRPSRSHSALSGHRGPPEGAVPEASPEAQHGSQWASGLLPVLVGSSIPAAFVDPAALPRGQPEGCAPKAAARPEVSSSSSGSQRGASELPPRSRPFIAEPFVSFVSDLFEDGEVDWFGISPDSMPGGSQSLAQSGHQSRNS